jgi:AraC-like DNA-binding protein
MQNDSAQVSDFPTLQSLLQLQLSYLLLRLCLAQELSFDPEKSAGRALVHYERFKIQLEKDFTTKHQVQHFGDALGLSVKILNRACLSSTGYSTKSCINQRIALEAKRLLAHTDAAVKSIAIDLGFDDPTNFVKFFKREAAMTPGQFRLSQVSMGN